MKVERTIVACRGRNPANPSDRKTRIKGIGVQMLEEMLEEIHGRKSQVLTTVDKDNWVLEYVLLGMTHEAHRL